ncbi:unnamed protein product, partial [Meganyctiphanes norvegica]
SSNMCYKLCLLILAVVGLPDILSSANCENTGKYNNTSSWCESPFQLLNKGCYFLSDDQMDFDGAAANCKSLTHGHIYEVILAMLENDKDDDQALLNAVTELDKIFWVGGKTDDGISWTWPNGQDIYLKAPFWDVHEPNEVGNNCTAAQRNTHNDTLTTVIRSYIYDHNCNDSINFICQKIKCPADFIKIGNYCYLQSWNYGLPELSWQDARDYCLSLDVHEGFYGDLAVLGLEGQHDYQLMNYIMVNNVNHPWIGASLSNECSYQWIDGRELPLESSYWIYDQPLCGDFNSIALYHANYSRTSLASNIDYQSKPFICQMFKNTKKANLP